MLPRYLTKKLPLYTRAPWRKGCVANGPLTEARGRLGRPPPLYTRRVLPSRPSCRIPSAFTLQQPAQQIGTCALSTTHSVAPFPSPLPLNVSPSRSLCHSKPPSAGEDRATNPSRSRHECRRALKAFGERPVSGQSA